MKTARIALDKGFIVFWLGVLTGVLVAGFIFLYQALTSAQYQDALLRYRRATTKSNTLLKGSAQTINPTAIPESGF